MEKRVYTTAEIARIIGKSIHKTISYVNRGYTKPSIQDASGHGSKRLWSYSDVVRMCFIMHLEDIGLKVEKIREMAEGMAEDRLAEHCVWSIDIEMRGDADVLHNLADSKPYVPPSITIPAKDFERCPGKIVFSMSHLHAWARKKIEAEVEDVS